MKKRTLLIISILSFLLAVGSFYLATKFIDSLANEKLFGPVVKVAKGVQIEPYEPITSDDVVLVQEEIDEIMPDTYISLQDVVGKRAVQTLFAGEQIIRQKMNTDQLLPGKGYARYEFPLTSILPITELRKGDKVKIWVKYNPRSDREALPAPTYFKQTNDSAEMLFESQLVTVKDNNGIEVYTLKPSPLPKGDQVSDALFHGSEAGKYTSTDIF